MTENELFYTVLMAETCAEVFVMASKENSLDMKEFAMVCLNNDYISDIYFAKGKAYKWWAEGYCLQDIMSRLGELNAIVTTNKKYNMEALYWIGYLYGYWACWGIDSASDIWKYAPFDEVMIHYPAYHTVDIEKAIELFKRD